MFITSEIPRLKKENLVHHLGFDMLIEPAGQSSRACKSMEPPAHDELNTSWIDSENERKKAEDGLSNLRRRVLELLERHLKIDVADANFTLFLTSFSILMGWRTNFRRHRPNRRLCFQQKNVRSIPSNFYNSIWFHGPSIRWNGYRH